MHGIGSEVRPVYLSSAMRFALIPALLFPLCLTAQEPDPWTLGTRGAVGFMAPHHKSLWVMVDRHAAAVEVYVQRPYSSEKAWAGNYLRPQWGFSALWLDAGSTILGPSGRLITYLELPLLSPGEWEFNARVGWGLGLVRHPFERLENYKQHAIGGRLNLAVQFALDLRRSFGRHALDLGLAMDHLSNAAMKQPNLGINVPSVALGYSYRLGEQAPSTLVPDPLWSTEPRTMLHAMANVGWNEVFPLSSGQRSVVSLSASAYRRVAAKSAFGLGVDVFNKGSLAVVDTSLASRGRISLTQVGIHGGYALLLGGMTLYYELGAYLYTPVTERAAVYTRLGVRQQVSEKLFLNFTLKAHMFVADHLEIGLGYRFR